MNIKVVIDKALKRFKDVTKTDGFMDLDFLIYELFQIDEFKLYLKSLFEAINRPEAFESINFLMNDYINNYQALIESMDSNELDSFLKSRTNDYNKFLLFLITQLKLIPEKEWQTGIALSVEWCSEKSLLGDFFTNIGITKDIIIMFNQNKALLQVSSALNKTKNDETDIDNFINVLKKVKGEQQASEANEKSALDSFCINMNEYVKTNVTNTLVGHTDKIDLIEESLFRKNKSGAVLVGKNGVGKDEICLGFIKNLKNSKFFSDYTVYKLNVCALQEGNVLRGQLEQKINDLLKCFLQEKKVIIYIEDMHTLFGQRPDTDIAQTLLTPFINNHLKIIATFNYNAWSNCTEENPQIIKYFQKIMVDEPSESDAISIVNKNLKVYEKYYNIKFDKKISELSVKLSNRYIFNKCLPEKAFDLIDIISAKVCHKDITNIISESDFLNKFSEIVNIPTDNLEVNDLLNFEQISKNLKKIIISQDEAIDKIINYIAIGKAGLREDNKTICNIFLKGTSGVGKTWLAQNLAKQLNIKLIRFDMSEYSEQHSVSKFLGTPPGYVGFSDANHGSLLISALEQNPRCVLLLDEIEKAHDTIYNVLLQAMDNGKITSTTGKEISLKNVVLIMTSNVGATAQDAITFGEGRDTAMEAMNDVFKPEFRTRLDGIITLNPVSKIDIPKVINVEIIKLNDMLKKYKKKINFGKEVIDYIEQQVKSNNLGLRIIKHIIDSEIKTQIIYQLSKPGNLKVTLVNDKLKVV